jgi:hypothetical protein
MTARSILTVLTAFALASACSPRRPPVITDDEDHLARGRRVHATRSDTDQPPSDCADDAREPDDEPGDVTASNKTVMGTSPVKIDGQVSCPGNEDWFHGYADCCRDVGATVTWNPADDAALRVDLLDASGQVIRLDGPGDSVERADGKTTVTAHDRGGDFYVRVRNFGGVRTPYSIEITAIVAEP